MEVCVVDCVAVYFAVVEVGVDFRCVGGWDVVCSAPDCGAGGGFEGGLLLGCEKYGSFDGSRERGVQIYATPIKCVFREGEKKEASGYYVPGQIMFPRKIFRSL